MRVDLSPELERLVELRLASGRDPEHVLGVALRDLEIADEEPKASAETLRASVAEGETSGEPEPEPEPEPYDMAAIQAGLDREGRPNPA